MNKIALVIGATGVVGKELVLQLLNNKHYSKVITFSRRQLEIQNDSLIQHIIDFNVPEAWQHLVQGDDFFCCIGTTLKQAGSKQNQKYIDFQIPVTFAKIAKKHGISQAILVSSTGADASSNSFYLGLKGNLENELIKLGFNKLIIVRPSVLVGQRDDFRLGEKFAIVLLNMLKGLPIIKRYRPIKGEQVARAMITFANHPDAESIVIKNLDELFL